MWSCSRLCSAHTAKQLLPELLLDSKLQHANPQDVSSTLRVVSKLGMRLTHVEVQQFVQQLLRVLPQANPQDVSRSLYALAAMGEQLADGELQQLLHHILQMQPDIRPSDAVGALWAIASMEHPAKA